MEQLNTPSIEEIIEQVEQDRAQMNNIRSRFYASITAAEALARRLACHRYEPEEISKTVTEYVRRIEPDWQVETSVESPHDVIVEGGYDLYAGTGDKSLSYLPGVMPGETMQKYNERLLDFWSQ